MHYFLFLACLLLGGCAAMEKHTAPTQLAEAVGMVRHDVSAGQFTLTTYARIAQPDQPLRVYIEGDGRAWVSRSQISPDPTPRTATGLLLAVADNWPNVAYIARPCQFRNLEKEKCDSAYWTNKRFSEAVMTAVGLVLDHYLAQTHANKVELIGYSGGAAIAALLAARRSDIVSLRTVAGNLDHAAVNRCHHVSPMSESLNPINQVASLRHLPQRHFVGEQDEIVPASVAQAFVDNQQNCARITVVPAATHTAGWVERWAGLLKLDVSCVSD
jgi:hypothetical protein